MKQNTKFSARPPCDSKWENGHYRHLNSLVGLGNPGTEFEPRNKGKIQLFCQTDWEELGGEESREIEEDR